jgi:protein TonB
MSMSTKLYSATALALACQLLFTSVAFGQTAETAGKAGSAPGISDSDRAKRDADKVLQWIKFHANHSAKQEAPPAPPKPAATAKAPAPKPATAQAAAPAPAASQEQQVAAKEPAKEPVKEAAREPEPAVAAAPKPELLAAAPATPPAPPAVEPTRAAPQPEPEPEEVALRLLQKVDPDIPRQLATSIRNGSVMVRFQVKPDGTTTKVESLGNPNKRLAASAIAAVQQWKFAPIPKQREATVEIGFKLD